MEDHWASGEIIAVYITVLLIALGIKYFFCNSNNTSISRDRDVDPCEYSYHDSCGNLTGVCKWKDKFPDSNGNLQSPININTCTEITNVPCSPVVLKFSSEYNEMPECFKIYNDGHTVTLHFRFSGSSRPQVIGGPLQCCYQFFSACFRWGANEDEGSEHTINCRRFALELQAMHIRSDGKYFSVKSAVDDGAVLIISYFFQAVKCDNIYLKSLTSALSHIREPNSYAEIEAMPMSCLMPVFCGNFYAYCGSLTYPPCSEGVRWMIQPEPLSISCKQLAKFKKLCGVHGPIIFNTRPVQNLNRRPILYYN